MAKNMLIVNLKTYYGKTANLIPREAVGILREAEENVPLPDLFVTHAHTYLCALLYKIIKWNWAELNFTIYLVAFARSLIFVLDSFFLLSFLLLFLLFFLVSSLISPFLLFIFFVFNKQPSNISSGQAHYQTLERQSWVGSLLHGTSDA